MTFLGLRQVLHVNRLPRTRNHRRFLVRGAAALKAGFLLFLTTTICATSAALAQEQANTASGTSLTDSEAVFELLEDHYVVLKRGDVEAIIVDNEAVDVPELPGHRAGYNGLASLRRGETSSNIFVPAYAGLNFEHIHDGTTDGLVEKFEPRRFPMQLRRIDEWTVEVYQPPTGNWRLESCGRYRLLEDGTIEYTFECIPRAIAYRQNYIGMFWASYLQQPADKSIYFRGHAYGTDNKSTWLRCESPRHGVDSTHPPAQLASFPAVDDDFPLTLVGNRSNWVHTDPWYFGRSGPFAVVQMFRPGDGIWFAQSPSGGGQGNPAWDFQWFIREPRIDQPYGFKMKLALLPFASREQVERDTKAHRDQLGK